MTSNQIGYYSENIVQQKLQSCSVLSQVSYLGGQIVSKSIVGATRPDLLYEKNGALIACEVKNYNLAQYYGGLKRNLKNQLNNRILQMPEGTQHRIILDVSNRGYSNKFVKKIINDLEKYLTEQFGDVVSVEANYKKSTKLGC